MLLSSFLLLMSVSSICAIHIPISPVPRAFPFPRPVVPEPPISLPIPPAPRPPSLVPDTPTVPNLKPKPDTPDVPDVPNNPDDGSITTSARPPVPTTSQLSWREWLNATSTYSVPETRSSGLVTGDGTRILARSGLMFLVPLVAAMIT
ncbi:hypothetical protein HBI56_123780 [Parastagonospora nodorum]|nr:hypothetical protein HBI06_054270 [Parastagonospora nodorum]KAH4248818.1 hypothetical protein HBI05_024610 [Parastagonospora nodorum]KAH4966319.1 hypothetical protein HBI78_093370 [Parastagonospora nodorum]KAH5040399.1 hypothetical protein HBI74_031360 [Parastagonospora nodorum]KAH5116565.1 hypothetical protein HBH71_111960 [Parastagonospora nodorum]